jgi:hypothetical protein
MKHRSLSIVSLMAAWCAVVGLSAGCTIVTTPVMPYTGSAFHHSTQPVDIRFDETPIGPRRGEAESAAYFFYLFAKGDASIMTAARDGGISRIDHVECEVFNVLGLYTRYRTIVFGS